MIELALEAPLARCLLLSGDLGCSNEIAIIASVLSVRSIWAPGKGHSKLIEQSKEQFAVRIPKVCWKQG